RYGEPSDDYPQMSYGYMWWLVDEFKNDPRYKGAYSATGYGGQYITVLPEMKMVIAHKTKLDLGTMIGITYKETSGTTYWEMIDQLINAKL
ncbi:MAG: hypothetical protein AAF242_21600, partial [Bacteroidota bacterium]